MDISNANDAKQAEEELSLIRKIMEDSRKAVYNNSIQGAFWSTLVAVTILLHYFMLLTLTWAKFIGILWLVSMLVGTVASILIARKEKREAKVKTFAGKILATLGFSVGGANTIFSFASVVAGAYNPVYIVPIDSIVLGLTFYVISVIQQLKTMKIISIIWWAGAVYFFVFPGIHCMLFLAVMLLVSVWIPGIEEKKTSSLAVN